MSRLRLRGGAAVTAPEEPPVDDTGMYGPRPDYPDGVAWVKAAVGPDAVSTGGLSGVYFTPASNINTLVTANPSGTNFIAASTGTYNNFRNAHAGTAWTQNPRFWFPGNASSYSINGGGATEAFLVSDPGFEVHGGTWTGYGSAAGPTWAAPHRVVSTATNPTIVVEDAVFNGNYWTGVKLDQGAPCRYTVRRCNITSNGMYGFNGYLAAEGPNSIHTFEYNYVYNNNTLRLDPADAAGGSKVLGCSYGSQYRYNWFKDNYGFDLWFDYDLNQDPEISDNVFEKSYDFAPYSAFHWEVACGLRFHHNYVRCTGTGAAQTPALRFAACDPTGTAYSNGVWDTIEVYNNLLDVDEVAPWRIWHQTTNRESVPPRGHGFYRNDVTVRVATATRTPVGSWQDVASCSHDWYTYGHWFQSNRYHVPVGTLASQHFRWRPAGSNPPWSTTGEAKTWSQWRAYANPTAIGGTFDSLGSLQEIA